MRLTGRFLTAGVLLALSSSVVSAAEPLKIRGGWVSAPNIILPFVFEKKDILKHFGKSYVFEAVRFTTTSLEVNALTNGDLELASVGYPALSASIVNAKLEDLRVVADGIQDGYEGYYSTEYMVLKNGPIKTIEDIKGKVVSGLAPGSAVDMPMRVMLRKHGLEEGRDYTNINVSFANMQPMLASEKIQLAATTTPWGLDPKTREVSRTLFTAREAVGTTSLIVLVMRGEFIEKNRPALVDFFEDYLRALQWFSDPANHKEVVEIISKFMKRPAEAMNYVFTKSDFYRDPHAVPSAELLQRSINMQKELGFLSTSIDVKKYVDASLVEEAGKRLKK